MGKALRRSSGDGEGRGRTVGSWRVVRGAWRVAAAWVVDRGAWRGRRGTGRFAAFVILQLAALSRPLPFRATIHETRSTQERLDRGRFTVVCDPSDVPLGRALLERAVTTDSFPGLPRPTQHVLITIAPDQRRFREWIGPSAPEWGAAVAFPETRRIVMQGHRAGSDAGDPLEVLRHELAHLALHEYLGDLPPRWFDEGYASYAARELVRNEVLAANFALALRGMPTLEELEELFGEGATSAQAAYALAYRAVDDLAAIDRTRGLGPFLRHWKETRSLDRAARAAYGITLASFERDWRQRTRRRYGGLALFSDVTLAGLVVLVIITPLYLARRRRDRRRMDALNAADAVAARSEEDGILESFLRSAPASDRPEAASRDEPADGTAEGTPGPGDEPDSRA